LLVADIGVNKTFIDNNSGARFLSYGPNSSTRGTIQLYQSSSANTLGQYALTIDSSGNSVFIGSVGAASFIKVAGTSSQFLKADGSVDSSTYLTTTSAASTYVPYTGATSDVNLGSRALSAGNILGITLSASQTSNSQASLSVSNAGTFRIADFNNSGALVAYITNAGGIYGSSFIKSGGSSSQFLKADGSVDSTSYYSSGGGIITGNVYMQSSGNPSQLLAKGTNTEFWVDSNYGGGTARAFVNRGTTSNQATLMFTTGISVTNGTAWAGSVDWSMGMTNDSTNNFYIGYGDIYSAGNRKLTLASTGAATFSSTITSNGGNILSKGGTYGIVQVQGSGASVWQMFANPSDQMRFGISGVGDFMTITNAGLVGIGSNITPINLLQVVNSSGQNDAYGNIQAYYSGSVSNANSGFTAKNYSGTSQFMQWEYYGIRIGSRILTNSGQGNVVFTYGNDTEGMRLTNDGTLRLTRSGGTVNFSVFQTGGGDNFCDVDGQVFRTKALLPIADNTYNLGSSGSRWTTVYATTALINTSDFNDKEQIEDLTESEKNVAIKLKGLIKKFKFKDSVALKGDNSRIHIGVIAQEVQEAFAEESLDATKYGLFCSDTWFELDGVSVDKETKGAIEKTKLGIRYEELITFIISQI
jgi:hypothetical protein